MSKFNQFKVSKAKRAPRKDAQTAKARWDRGQDDGIIILQYYNNGTAAGLRRLALLVAAFLVFKGFVIAYLGAVVHAQAVQQLSQGNLFEKAGAFVMYPDFASSSVASLLVQLVQ